MFYENIDNKIDIKENYIKQLDDELLNVLLKDRSSNKNIIWATDEYAFRGSSYSFSEQITAKAVTGRLGLIIRPRVNKSKKEQQVRIKEKAEVFTPSYICNKQNNSIDNDWFGKESVFNYEKELTWIVNTEHIVFPVNHTWQEYVMLNRLEVSCGEAPYLVSRYDTVTGEWLDVGNRIGLLDRKIRVVNENVDNEKDWVDWVINAYKSIFAFEWQGDSLLIARENLLFTFIDYYLDRFNHFPIKEYLLEIAKIISWNIWQMDGIKFVIPNSCKPIEKRQISLFEEDNKYVPCQGCLKNNNNKHTGIYCKIKNWETNRTIKVLNLFKEKK